ncbi:hypothetical protein KRMM14A1259_62300 [Krasilnikovia sp. MM14-A1259]
MAEPESSSLRATVPAFQESAALLVDAVNAALEACHITPVLRPIPATTVAAAAIMRIPPRCIRSSFLRPEL